MMDDAPERIWAEPYEGTKDAGRWTAKPRFPELPTQYTRVNQWVSVEDARPDDPDQRVLVCVEGVEGVHFGRNSRSRGMSAEGFWGDYKVTHWMPLPTPPGEIDG